MEEDGIASLFRSYGVGVREDRERLDASRGVYNALIAKSGSEGVNMVTNSSRIRGNVSMAPVEAERSDDGPDAAFVAGD